MKKIVLKILFFLSSLMIQSQNFEISKYEISKDSDYLKEKFDSSNMIISDGKSRYIELSSSEILLHRFISNQIVNTRKIKKSEIGEIKKEIDSLIQINPSDLLYEHNLKGETLKVQDGSVFEIVISKNDKQLKLISYSPNEYIDFKSINYEKRVTFLNAYRKIFSYFYDDTYKRIIDSDTLYIVNDKTIGTKQKNTGLNYKTYKLNENSIVIHKSEKLSTSHLKDKFLVNLSYLDQFTNDELFSLLKENKKTIFIIDKLKNNKKMQLNYVKAVIIL